MKSIARTPALILVPVLLLIFAPRVSAASIDENPPDPQTLAQMELRAQQANPRDQCYLYAELIHSMTDVAVHQIANGDDDKAALTLKQISHYAHLIESSLAKNTKRLKNAEILMDRTTTHLTEALHFTSGDDRANLQATLKQLNGVQNQLLDQVFNH
ncbi:hypothetical protein GCM10011507_10260 [Edaphobacter acidisoli]|uniref:DUF5667 domain-containing protein n=1 Tax=Edaphobacter acidisoli TaxID=2040573 RepID=A0A916W1Z1_9BACT|nr:hypothetical protein [Edaphobacter acidisoli]GGA60665.1 hypothetical protein GCM10011507_10260 [Edaphobacter acidisoli]